MTDVEVKKYKETIFEGTVLSSDTTAITWDPKNGFQLLLPDHSDSDIVSEEILLLSAIWNGICKEDVRIMDLYSKLVQEMKDA